MLKAVADADSALLAISPQVEGEYALDMISLFPQKTFKGHKNGLRADLAQAIADIHPRFVRFPGGCLAHGDGVDNIYNWKETIGPLEAENLHLISGDIIRHEVWDILNISSSVKI